MANIVVQITRGMAPAWSIAQVHNWAHDSQQPCILVSGLPTVAAKNQAVMFADMAGKGLILCEDDIMPTIQQWQHLSHESEVRLLSASCRNGELNVTYHGEVLYAGTVAVALPRAVLDRLPRPVFEAVDYATTSDGGELVPRGPNAKGHHSDIHLFYLLRHLDPRPVIRVVGHCRTFVTPLNSGEHDLEHPCELKLI